MADKIMNTDFYSVLTDEYFKNYLNRERFIWDSKQWIYNVYYALYKTSKSIDDDNIDNNTLKSLLEKKFLTIKFSPNIDIVINYIQKYKEKKNVLVKEILVSNDLLQDIYNYKFEEVMLFIKENYSEIYNKINKNIIKLNIKEIEKILLANKIARFESCNMYAYAEYELTKQCFAYNNSISQNENIMVKRKYAQTAYIRCKLFKNKYTKEYYNISVNLKFKHNIKRSAIELRYDEVVFNIIQSVALKKITTLEKGPVFVSLKEIMTALYGDNREITVQTRNRLLDSIYYMAYCVSYKINLEEVAEGIEQLSNNNGIRDNMQYLIENINSSNDIERPLLPINSLGVVEYNNNLLIEGIFISKLSCLYLIPFYMRFLRKIHLDKLANIGKIPNNNKNNVGITINKTFISNLLIIYLYRRLETKFSKRGKTDISISLDTVYEYFGLESEDNLSSKDREKLKKNRYEIKANIIKILESMKVNKYIIDYSVETSGKYKKCSFKIQLKNARKQKAA